MALNLLPMSALGAVESNGAVTFGLWLPWVSAGDGNAVTVKIIHEADQFLAGVPAREFPLTHSVRPPYGDFWSTTVPIAGTAPSAPGSAWGTPGRYVYRYTIVNPNVGTLDWIIDPFAREFGVGKLSAFTLGYQAYQWSAAEAQWRVPPLSDLIVYEVNVAELGGDLDRTRNVMAYLSDLGVNAIEVMPLSNVGVSVDWGYLPIGYFGVDERFGKRSDFQQLVDIAHQHGIAVIVDVVYGHTGVDFPYYDAYTRLKYNENPFMGPFAKDYFSNFGKSTDFGRQLTRDFFFSASNHWLEVYHVDGFRYDCVPNYWDGPLGVGYASLAYETYQLAKRGIAAGQSHWRRFDAGGGRADPAHPDGRAVGRSGGSPAHDLFQQHLAKPDLRHRPFGRPRRPRAPHRVGIVARSVRLSRRGNDQRGRHPQSWPLQYIENHDHERFLCNFGLINPDEAGNPLFLEGDRNRWYMLQPYLIALLMSKGIPMLWQGQELAENYFLPDFGAGRVSLLRPLRWDYFYDGAGRSTISLVRKLLRIRAARSHIRGGTLFFFNHWDRYQSLGLLLFARYEGAQYTLVAVNTTDNEQTVPFWFPASGDYVEELHGGDLDLKGVAALQEHALTIPSHYGRIWTKT